MAEQALLWHTRPRDDSAFFAAELAPFGIESIIGPVLHISPKPIANVTNTAPDALLITSRHATHALSTLPPTWRKLPTYCVGNATAQAASDHGMTRIIKGTADVQALLPRMGVELSAGSNLLYIAGDETRTDVQKLLATRGINVSMAVVYHATPEHSLGEEIRAALAAGKVGSVAFFSPRSARIACELMAQADVAHVASNITAYCFSLNVAEEAGRLPWAAIHICAKPTRAAMRDLIVSHHAKSE